MTSIRRPLAGALLFAGISLVVAACGSTTDTPVTPVTPAIAFSANTAAVSIVSGSNTTATLSIARSGGFTGDVTLTAEGVPAGVTATFNPPSIGSAVTSSVVTIAVGSTAVAATTTITLRASGAGITSKTVTIAVTVLPTLTPAISLAAGTGALSIVAGTAGTVPLTITRSGGFTGDVTLAATGLPTGVTASFAPATLTAAVTSSTMTLTAAASAVSPATAVTVTASGTGVTSQTATVSLTVTAANAPDFALTASPASLSVAVGQTGTSTVTLTRTGGFSGSVNLALEGAPTGVTGTFAPNPATAGTSTLTLAVAATTVPGAYNLVLRGSAGGQTDRTTVIALTVAPGAGISLTIGSPTLSAAVGATATSTVTIARVGGFTGDVALAATGLPTGVTASFAPATLTAGVTTSTLTLTVAASAVPATSSVTITASGTGVTAQTGTIALTVTGAQGYALAATNVSAQQGATGTSTVTITRSGGFAGTVNLAVTGLPAGVTSTFTPAAATGTSSSLALAVGGSVAAGTYTGTITGTATGLANVVTTFTLSVTAVGGGSAVSYRFCAANGVPVFFAFRNGSSGSWTPVTVGANSTFNFSLTASTGQVAFGVPASNGGVQMNVLFYTASEFPSVAGQQCTSNPATKTVTGTVAGLAAGQSATIALGAGTVGVQANGAFSITGATDGPTDLVATRTSINLTTFTISVDKVIIRRNLNPTAGGSIGAVLDFGAAEAVAPASALYTINNANGEMVAAINSFTTANGGTASFSNFSAAGTSPVTLFGVPSSLTQAGDLHAATAFASVTAGALTTIRAAFQYNRDVAPRSFNLGAGATAPTVTSSASAPYARPRVQGTWQSDYPDVVALTYSQGTRSWSITASRAFFGSGSTSFDVDLPDLSGVAGFSNAWGLLSGTSATFGFNVYGGFAGLTAITEGSSFKFGSRSTTITP